MEKRYNLGILEALFKDALISENCSPNTRKNYLSDVRHFLYWFQWVYSSSITDDEDGLAFFISTFSHNDLRQYVAGLQENRTPIRSINRKLSSLRRFAAFCQSRGFVSHNSADNIENLRLAHHDDHEEIQPNLNSLQTYDNSPFPLDLQNALDKELLSVCEETFHEIMELHQK